MHTHALVCFKRLLGLCDTIPEFLDFTSQLPTRKAEYMHIDMIRLIYYILVWVEYIYLGAVSDLHAK